MIAVGLRRLNWMLSERGIPGEAAKGGSWSETGRHTALCSACPPSLSHSLASTGLYCHSEDRLTVHIYMWSAWLKVCTYMHMYFLVSKGFTLSVVTPGVLVKNLKKYATKNTLHWKNQEWAGDKAMMAIHYTPVAGDCWCECVEVVIWLGLYLEGTHTCT